MMSAAKTSWFETLGSKAEMRKTVVWAYTNHSRYAARGKAEIAADYLATAHSIIAELEAMR